MATEARPAAGRDPGHPLAHRVGFLLSKLGYATTAMFSAALEPLGLRRTDWAVMNMLDAGGSMSQHEIGASVRIDASSMVALIDRLERTGIVERRRDEDDRRRYAIRLTAKGRRTLARARAVADRHEETLLAPLSAEERELLRELLTRLASAGHLPPTPHPPLTRPSD